MKKVKFHYYYPIDVDIDTEKDVDVYIDKFCMDPVPKDAIRIVIIEEPKKNELFDFVQDHRDRYTHVLTFHNEILLTNSKARQFLCMRVWMHGYVSERKKFSVSTVVGGKKDPLMKGYAMRHELWRSKERITIPKEFYLSGNDSTFHVFVLWKEVDYTNELVLGNTKEPLFDSMFHVAIENTSIRNYFSEKLLDCFQSCTVPIYYGCRNIGDFFNTDGIFIVNSVDEMVDVCNKLTPKVYEAMQSAIEDNFNRSKRWSDCDHDEQIKNELTKLLSGEQKIDDGKVFVQIGTYTGKDEFNKLVKKHAPSKVILVEPNKAMISRIENNYAGVNNVFLESVAITKTNKREVELVIPKNNVKGRSINGIRYKESHFSLLPMDDWGNDFIRIVTPSMTFNELCEKYEINDIHYLQIDTEGYDAEIIKSIDFDKINIDALKYEIWKFPADCFKRHGAKAELYGINGMEAAESLLKSLGYTLTQDKSNITAVKV